MFRSQYNRPWSPGMYESISLLSEVYGGGRRIRTSEVADDRFTVCSLWPLGNPSRYKADTINSWSWRWDSNPQPADYKSAALPIELRQRSHLFVRISDCVRQSIASRPAFIIYSTSSVNIFFNIFSTLLRVYNSVRSCSTPHSTKNTALPIKSALLVTTLNGSELFKGYRITSFQTTTADPALHKNAFPDYSLRH